MTEMCLSFPVGLTQVRHGLLTMAQLFWSFTEPCHTDLSHGHGKMRARGTVLASNSLILAAERPFGQRHQRQDTRQIVSELTSMF